MKNFTYDDELYHYGVKGMRWRHRRAGRKPLGGEIVGKDSKGAGEVANPHATDYQGNPVSRRDTQIGLHRLAYKREKNIPLDKGAMNNAGYHRADHFGFAARRRELTNTNARNRKSKKNKIETDSSGMSVTSRALAKTKRRTGRGK